MNYTSLSDFLKEVRRTAARIRRNAVKTPPGCSALAFCYTRFSSAAQADGTSVLRQTQKRDAWLARHPKVRLDDTLDLTDHGVPAFKGRNLETDRALGRFLALVR